MASRAAGRWQTSRGQCCSLAPAVGRVLPHSGGNGRGSAVWTLVCGPCALVLEHEWMGTDTETALVAVMRDEWPRLIAASMRIVGDLQTAEDVVSDTLLTALD